MRKQNSQFKQIGVRDKHRFLLPIIFCLIFIMTFSTAIPIAMAYFTATANQTGSLSFAALTTSIIDNSGTTLTNGTFASTFLSEKLLPGKEIEFTNIKVKNTSNIDIYTLLKLVVTITKTGETTLTYSNWYTLDGEIVTTSDFSTNNNYATNLASNGTANVDLTYTIPTTINSNYKSATAEFTLSAHSIQDYVPEASGYVDETNYKTYLIIKNTDNLLTEFTTRGIPETYQIVNYLQNTGTQYINTGMGANSTTRIELSFQYNTILSSGYNRIFGERNNDEKGLLNIRTSNSSGGYLFIEADGNYTDSNAVSLDVYDVIIDSLERYLYINGTRRTSISIKDNAEDYDLYLFGTLNGGVESNVKIFNYKMYNNEVLMQHLVPVKRISDTKPGLYDKVNGVFFTNAGTGEFLYG